MVGEKIGAQPGLRPQDRGRQPRETFTVWTCRWLFDQSLERVARHLQTGPRSLLLNVSTSMMILDEMLSPTQPKDFIVLPDLPVPVLLSSLPLCNICGVYRRTEPHAITVVDGGVRIRPARREVILGKIFRDWPWRSNVGLFAVNYQ